VGRGTVENQSVTDARLAAADYIAELAGSLAAVARLHGLDVLSYVLEMARLEAQSSAQNSPPN
jgi:hypothetical protein